MADRTLRIRLLANTDSYRAEMERASRLGSNYYKSAENSSKRLTNYINQNTNAFNGLNRNIQVATNTLKTFAGAFIGGFAVSGIVNVADNYGQMAQRIRNSLQSVEGDFSNYEMVQNRLLETSIRNAKDLADSQELYIRSAESMKDLGYSTSQTLDFVESLSSAFTSNATSSDKVKSSIDALNKAFVSGKVSAQQWQTLSAAMPNLSSQIATALGKERDQIVKLGNAGKLSITQLANGTIKAKDSFNALADSMDNTIKDGFVQLSNAFQHWVGEANQTNKVTASIASGMTYLAKNFDLVVDAGSALIALSLARYFGNLSTSVKNSTIEMAKEVAEIRGKAIAQKEALTVDLQALSVREKALLLQKQNIVLAQTHSNSLRAQTSLNAQLAVVEKNLSSVRAEQTIVTNNLAAANTRASLAANALNKAGSLLKSGIGLLGGPAGAAMLAGGALYYFSQKSEEAKQRALNLSGEIDKLTTGFEKLTDAQLELRRLNLLEEQENINTQIATQQFLVDQATKKYENLLSRANSWYSSWTSSENDINEQRKVQLEQTEKLNKLLENEQKVKQAISDLDHKRNFVGPVQPENRDSSNRSNIPVDTTAYDNQKKRLDDLLRSTKLLTEYDKVHYEIKNGSLKKLDPLQQKTLENLAKEIDLTKKRDDLKKSLESLGTPIEKQEALYKANNKIINDSLKAGIIDKEKANKKLEELEKNHQLAIAKIKSETIISDIDQAVALVDPVKALENENAKKLALIQEFENQKLLTEQQALTLREAQNYEFEQNRIAAQWEIWSKQSEANEFLAASLEGLASSATSTISGLLSGTMSATEAMQNFANVILNEAIGSLVQMGLRQVQNAIMGQTAAQTSTAAQLVDAAALTTAYSSAAMQASIASYGAAATVGAASYTSALGVMKSASLVGMAHDGIDNVPKEGTWLLDKGERVLSPSQNKDFSSLINKSGSKQPQVIINNNNGSEVTASYDEREQIIKIAVNRAVQQVSSELSSGTGSTSRALRSRWNTNTKTD